MRQRVSSDELDTRISGRVGEASLRFVEHSDAEVEAVVEDLEPLALREPPPLGLGVGERRGLVEDQHGGVGQDGARDGQPLALAAGQSGPRTQDGVIALRQPQDALVDRGGAGGGLNPVAAGVRHGLRDVLRDRAVHELGVLEHESDPAVQVVGVEGADVDAVDAHRALVDVVEPGQQRGQRGLARPGRPDQRGHRARAQGQVDVLDDRDLGTVAEGDAGEHHGAVLGGGPGLVAHREFGFVERALHPPGGQHAALDAGQAVPDAQ